MAQDDNIIEPVMRRSHAWVMTCVSALMTAVVLYLLLTDYPGIAEYKIGIWALAAILALMSFSSWNSTRKPVVFFTADSKGVINRKEGSRNSKDGPFISWHEIDNMTYERIRAWKGGRLTWQPAIVFMLKDKSRVIPPEGTIVKEETPGLFYLPADATPGHDELLALLQKLHKSA